jgi:hypothetical protein
MEDNIMIKNNLLIPIISLLLILTTVKDVKAEYDIEKLMREIGRYLGAVCAMEAFKSSDCAFAARKEYSTKKALDEALKYVRPQDRQNVISIIEKTNMIEDQMNFHKEQIHKVLSSAKKENYDKGAACGFLAAGFAQTYTETLKNWDITKLKYGWSENTK